MGRSSLAAVAVAAPESPGHADYLFTTNGTTITRYDRTGAVSASGTDLGALVNGVAANFIFLAFGAGVFPWTTAINLDDFYGISLRGAGRASG